MWPISATFGQSTTPPLEEGRWLGAAGDHHSVPGWADRYVGPPCGDARRRESALVFLDADAAGVASMHEPEQVVEPARGTDSQLLVVGESKPDRGRRLRPGRDGVSR